MTWRSCLVVTTIFVATIFTAHSEMEAATDPVVATVENSSRTTTDDESEADRDNDSHGDKSTEANTEKDTHPGHFSPRGLAVITAVGWQGSALLYSWITRWRGGAYFTGSLWGLGVPGGLVLAAEEESTKRHVGLGLGLTAYAGPMAYYNFRYAKQHSNRRKFWTNYGAASLPMVGLILLLVTSDGGHSHEGEREKSGAFRDVTLGVTGNSVNLRVRF